MDFGTSKKIVVIFKRAASVIEMGPIRCPGAQEGMHLVCQKTNRNNSIVVLLLVLEKIFLETSGP